MSDPRIEQAEQLLESFRYEIAHCRQVRDLAMQLFDQLAPLHQLGADERAILNAAALLHDIGWSVSGEKHHKHSYQLIKDNRARLAAFTPPQIELVAQAARYHRKSTPSLDHEPFAALSKEERRIIEKLAALMRVADGLDRPHLQSVTTLGCEITDRHVTVRVKVLTEPEAHIEGAARKREWFETAFGLPIEFLSEE